MNTTGDRIRELRIKNNLTLDDVARHLGVGRQAIYKYEQGTVTNIPLVNLEKMAHLFNVSPSYLACWNEEPPDNLSSDEDYLVITYRSLPQPGKEYLLQQAQIAKITFGEKSSDISSGSTLADL